MINQELSKQKILIIDEQPDSARLLTDTLVRECYDTTVVSNAFDAFRQLLSYTPQLLLLDTELSGIDGLDLCRELRKSSEVPIIILSAKTDIIDKILALELGADDYLTKPYDMRELTARIKAVLRRTCLCRCCPGAGYAVTVSDTSALSTSDGMNALPLGTAPGYGGTLCCAAQAAARTSGKAATAAMNGTSPVPGSFTANGASPAPGSFTANGASPVPGSFTANGASLAPGSFTANGASPAPGSFTANDASPVPGTFTANGASPVPGAFTASAASSAAKSAAAGAVSSAGAPSAALFAAAAGQIPENSKPQKLIQYPGLSINLTNYSVIYLGKTVEMPPRELELLYFLAASPNQVFTRSQLLDHVWGYEYAGDTRTVDVHIKRIRAKIKNFDTWSIATIWGVGYKFQVK